MIGLNGFRGVRQYAQSLFSLFKLNVADSYVLFDPCGYLHLPQLHLSLCHTPCPSKTDNNTKPHVERSEDLGKSCRGCIRTVCPSKTDNNTKPHVERSEGMGKSKDQDVWRRRCQIDDLSEAMLPTPSRSSRSMWEAWRYFCLRRT